VLLVIDPYNDFISDGGKIWPRIKNVAEGTDCVPHMLEVLNAAMEAKLRVFYALHRRYRPCDYETWTYIAHTCVESTVRFAAELGYDVTLVKDAIADYSDEFMHAALVTNLPNYSNAIVGTNELIEAIHSPFVIQS
jgi:nicotinamidase-related amidase